jgi:hypothetical protein
MYESVKHLPMLQKSINYQKSFKLSLPEQQQNLSKEKGEEKNSKMQV